MNPVLMFWWVRIGEHSYLKYFGLKKFAKLDFKKDRYFFEFRYAILDSLRWLINWFIKK